MTTKNMPVRFEMSWNDSEVENPSIELRIENTSRFPVRLEVQWGYWNYDSKMPATAIGSFPKECPTGGLIQWAEEMIDQVGQGESKTFHMFGEELHRMMAVTQILSIDLHCLWVRVNEERYLLLDGGMFAFWLEHNVVPLFEVE